MLAGMYWFTAFHDEGGAGAYWLDWVQILEKSGWLIARRGA